MLWWLLACSGAPTSSEAPAPSTPDRADTLALCAAFEACALEDCSEEERAARFREAPVSTPWALDLREELASAELLDGPGYTLSTHVDAHDAREGPCVAVYTIWSRAR